MGIRRERVEMVLDGRHVDVGIGPQTIPRRILESIAARVIIQAGAGIFATPDTLAVALGLRVIDAELPSELLFICDGRTIIVEPQEDPMDRGLLVLGAISQHALATMVGAHTLSDVCFLTAELSAPSSHVLRKGIDVAVRARRVPTWFLRAWERILLAAPPSQSCVG